MSHNSDPFVELVGGLLDLAYAARAFTERPGAVEELNRILYDDHRDGTCRSSISDCSPSIPPARPDTRVRHNENSRCMLEGSLPSNQRRNSSKVSLFCTHCQREILNTSDRLLIGGSVLSVLRSIRKGSEGSYMRQTVYCYR